MPISLPSAVRINGIQQQAESIQQTHESYQEADLSNVESSHFL